VKSVVKLFLLLCGYYAELRGGPQRCAESFFSRRDAEALFGLMALKMPGLRYILVTDEDEK